MKDEYNIQALTNNLKAIEYTNGGFCIHCRQTVTVQESKQHVLSDNTIVCPHCGIDAVTPLVEGYTDDNYADFC